MRAWVYGLLVAFVAGSLFPFYWGFLIGSRAEVSAAAFTPGGHFLDNVRRVFDTVPFWRALGNSVVVAGTVTVSTVVFASLAGFAFARVRFPGRDWLFTFVVATMAVPTQLGVIPLYLAMAELGWAGGPQAVIVPNLVTALGVFWMRQYTVSAVPAELVDAARVDGCSLPRVYWHVCLPAVRPALASLGMFTFMASWNDFLWPLVVLDADHPTVQLALERLQSGHYVDYPLVLAGATLATVPVLVVFAVLGRRSVDGVALG
ncbi:carbohydrate ABC transporter permease [Actinokineospora diospyrosa]|uniref:Cellobiose ABC transporter membrane protein n=1 Tax=Actinokineospora diospyrosa TaxID=103728 RepID=A0ABT1I5C3_9PSEU|nr:carbohydrate ABC transporter permease [Actinokineospora diospyrosa]MCP2267771.1 cellobiose ABC transporter membrane protein [Actinokineospora diospyrosa]